MSIDAMRWAKRQTTGSASRKAVLMALADYADEHGCAWPSQDRIATETEMTSRSVRSCIADLVELGLVTRKTKRNADGTRATDRLYLALDNDQRKEIPVDASHRKMATKPPENHCRTTGNSFRVTPSITTTRTVPMLTHRAIRLRRPPCPSFR